MIYNKSFSHIFTFSNFALSASAMCLLWAFSSHVAYGQISYSTSWIGNSFPGGDPNGNPGTGNWVPDRAWDAFVLPDGTVITHADWDERGCEVCVFKDGRAIQPTNLGTGGFLHTHGTGGYNTPAVVASGSDVYLTYVGSFGRFNINSRDFVPGTPGFVNASSKPLAGLGLGNGEVYVSAPGDNQIKVYNATTLAPIRTFSFTAPGKLTVDKAGTLWIIQASTNTIFNYTSTGSQRSSFQLPNSGQPSALAIDNQGRLMIGDSGPSQQVLFYSVTGEPTLVATFGVFGGIYSGSPGQMGDLKLISPTGVGTDNSGNIYVISNFAGTSIRKFSPSGSLLWHLKGLSFIDGAVADPGSDGVDLYTKHQHFTMDYTRGPGQEWSWAGMLINKFKYPTDPYLTLLSGGNTPVAVRNIQGRKYLFTTDMGSRSLSIYRIEGDTAVPSGMIAPIRPADAPSQLANFGVSSWLPGIAPQNSSFIWRDSDGNGNVDANEFYSVTGEETGIWGWDIDNNGNIWQTVEASQGVREFSVQGVDSAGNLIYDRAHLIVYGVPAPFTQIERVQYDSGNDVLYLSGYTAAHPIAGGMWGQAGTEIARYDNWSKGNRNPRWRITLPYDVAANRTVKAISVAGGCVFAGMWQSGVRENVYVYGSGTGAMVGQLTPGPEVGSNMGWIEGSYSLRAFQRANGEYLVFVTDEAWNKVLMYRMSTP